MQTYTKLFAVIVTILALTVLAGCGGAPATLNDIPAYPGATELKPGESHLGDTLAECVKQFETTQV